ncbi:unnamed protein product [Gongylonema pulchrum]|uniref:Protein kinase domain-containing protein n=1 Tax=Gongylonema pulchrum TaxID=637853 RepID=A0A3P6QB02_9BILA|nr:unnamed protein product [Gongylonema pulchrum]
MEFQVLPNVAHSRREVELQRLASDHPHIVKIVDVYENKLRGSCCLFVVLEYMSGMMKNYQLTERDTACIMHDLGLAVEHIHALNIAHRDIKPENVMYKYVLKILLEHFFLVLKRGL